METTSNKPDPNKRTMRDIFKLLLCVFFAKIVSCDKDADGSCTIGGMQVEGCNEEMSDETKAELLKEQEERENNMSEEEKEAELKSKYKKLFFTNNYDWKIREELDAADDVIHSDTKKAIELFEDILKRYPESARAQYALIRSKVMLV